MARRRQYHGELKCREVFDIKIRKNVFYPTVLMILAFSGCYFFNDELVSKASDWMNQAFNQTLGWFYLVVALFLVIVTALALFSKFGKSRIGGSEAKPMLSTWNWFAVVLCTTIAAGLIFWGACEPIYHLMAPPEFLGLKPGSHESAVFSMTTMFLHWTITPYAIYGIPALAFAFAVYNRRRAFSFSSCIVEAVPKAGGEQPASIIDSLCVFSTVMGMIASLGQGILSIAGGITEITERQASKTTWILIGITIAVVFTVSACSGVLKGIKWISNINTVFLLGLLLFVFIAGPAAYIIQLSLESFGVYIDNFFTRSLMMGAGSGSDWSYFWTISTFANWMAWAPVTGMFLGKISYGHSVRSFIGINILASAAASGLWINIFGGTAISQQLHGVDLYGKMESAGMESAVYTMLENLPAGMALVPVLVIVVLLSVVTAADSTTNVLGNLCCQGEEQEAGMIFVKVVWGVLLGAMSILMVCSKGIAGIKMISVIGGIPAVFLLLLSGISLLKNIMLVSAGNGQPVDAIDKKQDK